MAPPTPEKAEVILFEDSQHSADDILYSGKWNFKYICVSKLS